MMKGNKVSGILQSRQVIPTFFGQVHAELIQVHNDARKLVKSRHEFFVGEELSWETYIVGDVHATVLLGAQRA